MRNATNQTGKRKGNGTARDTGEDYACQYRVIAEYCRQHPLEMIVYEKRGKQKTEVLIDGERIVAGGVVMEGPDARCYASSHKGDIEKLVVESAKQNGEERALVSALHMAALADKAGQSGRYAALTIKEGNKLHHIRIGRKGDAPVFRLGEEEMPPEQAKRFLSRNYAQFLVELQKAEAGLYRHRVEKKEEEIPRGKNGKPVIDLDRLLPKEKKAVKNGKDLHSLGDPYLAKRTKSYLKHTEGRK